jgi:hypothetical protein
MQPKATSQASCDSKKVDGYAHLKPPHWFRVQDSLAGRCPSGVGLNAVLDYTRQLRVLSERTDTAVEGNNGDGGAAGGKTLDFVLWGDP